MINIQNIDFDGTYGEARAKNSNFLYILSLHIDPHQRTYSAAVSAAGLLSVGSLVRLPLSSNVCYVCVIFAATQIIYACCNSTMRILMRTIQYQHIVSSLGTQFLFFSVIFVVVYLILVLCIEFCIFQ
jgi:hypothetical protein